MKKKFNSILLILQFFYVSFYNNSISVHAVVSTKNQEIASTYEPNNSKDENDIHRADETEIIKNDSGINLSKKIQEDSDISLSLSSKTSENFLKNMDDKKTLERKVIGDSRSPLIDLSSIGTVDSMVFSEGDPADHLPWKTAEYYQFAKDQQLKELVRNFCVMQSMDVIVSDTVNDVVNGKFSNVTPYQFWKDIISAYGLVWFFDGSMMYVYKSNEVTSAVYQMNRDEMRTLVKVITQLGWLSSNVTFRPLETAGILVVSGPPKLMSLIEELLKKIVIERVSNVYDIRSFPLKHAWAYDMTVNYRGGSMLCPGVATMLQQIVGALPGGPVGDSNVGLSIDNSNDNEAMPMSNVFRNYNPKKSKEKDKSKDKNQKANQDNAKGKDKGQNPLNLGDIFVIHDTRLNAVIVKAKRQDMHFIEDIIRQLDVPRNAIKIEVAVVDITKAGALKIGSKFIVSKRDTNTQATTAMASPIIETTNNSSKKANKTAVSTPTASMSASTVSGERIALNFLEKGSSSITMSFDKLFSGYSLAETLNILEDVGNAQTLTRSSVITLDNIGAVIDRSSTVYTPVKSSKGGLYDVTVSTKLIVVPHIIPEDFDSHGSPKIKLLIEVTDGTFDKDARIDASSPATATHSVNTEASIFEGQSLFIGGYFHENHTIGSAGIPFFKDIPLLGHLFKTSTRDDSVVERIYIITPTIIKIDDPKTKQLGRFFTDGQLAGEATLKPDEFILTHEYEKPSFEKATYQEKEIDWRIPFRKDVRDPNDPELQQLETKRRLIKARRR